MAFLHELVRDCLQDEQAFCSVKCPFNLDVRDFVSKLQQGRYNAAYKTYQNTVGFPGIVTALCPEPCRAVCPMKEQGGSISLKLLEAASIRFARNREPDQYNMPGKPERIAIVGAGISGLACALRLTTKKYNVTLFEKSSHIGGHLLEHPDYMSFIDDINLQFMNENYELRLNHDIADIGFDGFDAVYIATGLNGSTFGVSLTGEGPYSTNRQGVFMGGSVTGAETMEAIAHGLNVCTSIEGYLKTGQMNHFEPLATTTKLIPEAVRVIPAMETIPENGSDYTKEEARAEAARCIRCTCDACVRHSPLLSWFRKFPKRITGEVEVSINPSSLDGEATLATRLIATCNYCGLCKEVCPMDIDTGEFLLRSHHTMREKGKMPWAFHEFFLRDMEFSNGEASLLILPDRSEKVKYIFFPGCQIGASDPRLVTMSYEFLLEHYPGTALMLGCCGAPADWAGNGPVHNEVKARIRKVWTELGEPGMVFACAMCSQMFSRHMPEIKGSFLYNIIDETGSVVTSVSNTKVSVFDPCASRHEAGLQSAVRSLALKAGFSIEPLLMEGKLAECCSYGGQVSVAHPPYAEHMAKTRINQNSNPYITYCSNCRDIFAKAGKDTKHILDVVFDLAKTARPTVSERRKNRMLLKRILLKKYCNEDIAMEMKDTELIVTIALKEKLDKCLILESDIITVIEACEKTGNKLINQANGTFMGHLMIGNMTLWVEYRVAGEKRYELVNSYNHRMKIEE